MGRRRLRQREPALRLFGAGGRGEGANRRVAAGLFRHSGRPARAPAQSVPKVALRSAVYVHHGAAAAPRMKSVAAMKVSSTHGSWRWPVASHRRR